MFGLSTTDRQGVIVGEDHGQDPDGDRDWTVHIPFSNQDDCHPLVRTQYNKNYVVVFYVLSPCYWHKQYTLHIRCH